MVSQFRLAVVSAALAFQAPLLVAQDVELHELYCRGGPGLSFRVVADPSPRSPEGTKYVRMALKYRVASGFKSDAPQTLLTGSCGWDMQFSKVVPPGEVLFDVEANGQALQVRQGVPIDRSINAALAYPDSASVPRYLTQSDHFWVFFAWDRPDSVAVSHAPWQPDLAAIIAAAAETPKSKGPPRVGQKASGQPKPKTSSQPKDFADTQLRFVGVTRSLDQVTIQFQARKGASPTVNYSTNDPLREPTTGRWFFEGGALEGSGAVSLGGFQAEVSEARPPAVVLSSTYTARTRPGFIERGKLYNFIITVPEGIDQPRQQHVGTFTTMQQDLTVTFSSFKIIKSTVANVDWGHLLCSGDSSRTSTWMNAPDHVTLYIYAVNHDSRIMNEDYRCDSAPGKNAGLAKQELDLRSIRGRESTILQSMFADIMFWITTTVDVVRR